MTRLFLKCLFILIVVGLLNILAIYLIAPIAKASYYGASLDKQQSLENHQPGSVLLVGGSNVPFGYDSTFMEGELGRPVINTGLHAGLGLRFILNSVSPYIREGDIVLLSIEYEHYKSPDVYDSDALRRMLDIDFRQNVRFITTPAQWQTVVNYHADYMAQGISLALSSNPCPGYTYCRASFDEHGDIRPEFNTSDDATRMILQDLLPTIDPHFYDFSLLPEVARLMNDFGELVSARNATAMIIFPAIPDVIFDQIQQQIQDVAQEVHDEINIPLLNEPIGYPQSYFYDTMYHLNNEGRTAHTADIMPLLIEALNP